MLQATRFPEIVDRPRFRRQPRESVITELKTSQAPGVVRRIPLANLIAWVVICLLFAFSLFVLGYVVAYVAGELVDLASELTRYRTYDLIRRVSGY